MMNIKMFFIVVFLTGMLLTGDYLIKAAVKDAFPISLLFLAMIFWSVSVPGWYYALLDHNISLIGMLFSVLSLVGSCLIGMFFFNERLSGIEWLGLFFGIVSTFLLASKL